MVMKTYINTLQYKDMLHNWHPSQVIIKKFLDLTKIDRKEIDLLEKVTAKDVLLYLQYSKKRNTSLEVYILRSNDSDIISEYFELLKLIN